ncbi:protein ENHANCED DOWNY MILDEW 2-like [Bidens hawaiensis]|uniref:protein ENHANCED DOWNY MILDEW 2-like n=1 Tax=Bidens hawaiensis TaxID=980011 RepID=UPI0040498C31
MADDINGEVVDDNINITNNSDNDIDLDGEDEDDDVYVDTVCAICDNGGELICCEGGCFRAFHQSPNSEAARESNCESLRLTSRELEGLYIYHCENCRYSLHQCGVCGELGRSDILFYTEVFRCSFATCGHFYHPKCVAKLLQNNDITAQRTLKHQIAAGEPFICPAHRCAVCNQIENERVVDFQFAICRRCPKAYHRRCLPRGIKFAHDIGEDDDDDDARSCITGTSVASIPIVRAWDGLLPKSRALIYCLEHEIDPDLGTAARTIICRNILV